MPTRASQSDDTIFREMVDHPPILDNFVLGRWHQDTFRLRSYVTEARVRAKAAISRPAREGPNFLIISRARSGTTLFIELMRSHPKVQAEMEILKSGKLFPLATILAHARKSVAQVYGAKLLSYQMAQVHRMKRPVEVLDRLQANGFKFIHIERNTLQQCFSLSVAQKTGNYYNRGAAQRREKIWLDPDAMLRQLSWNQKLLEYERRLMSYFDPMRVSYETDLVTEEAQQAVANRAFEMLVLEPHPVQAKVKKLMPQALGDAIENYDEIAAAIRAREDLAHLLPEGGETG